MPAKPTLFKFPAPDVLGARAARGNSINTSRRYQKIKKKLRCSVSLRLFRPVEDAKEAAWSRQQIIEQN